MAKISCSIYSLIVISITIEKLSKGGEGACNSETLSAKQIAVLVFGSTATFSGKYNYALQVVFQFVWHVQGVWKNHLNPEHKWAQAKAFRRAASCSVENLLKLFDIQSI